MEFNLGLGRFYRRFALAIKNEELGAILAERGIGLALAKPINLFSMLAQTHGQRQKIAIARRNAKSVDLSRVEKIHGPDCHGDVRRILSLAAGNLENWLEGKFADSDNPLRIPVLGKVAEDCPYDGISKALDVTQNVGEKSKRNVVGVYQQCKARLVHFVLQPMLDTH